MTQLLQPVGSHSDVPGTFVLHIFPAAFGESTLMPTSELDIETAPPSDVRVLDSRAESPQGEEIIWGHSVLLTKINVTGALSARLASVHGNSSRNNAAYHRITKRFQNAMPDHWTGGLGASSFFSLPVSSLPPSLPSPLGFFPASPFLSRCILPSTRTQESEERGESPGLQS